MKQVLLTNGQQRKTLAAARSLGRKGIKPIVAEETRFNPSAFSKYSSRNLVCPSPVKKPEEFFHWLCEAIRQNQVDLLFPMDDDTMEIVMKYRPVLEKLVELPLPSVESYHTAADKGLSVKLAQKAGVPCPSTLFPASLESLENLVSGLQYPIVIKPRKSAGSRGIRVVRNREELLRQYAAVHKEYPFPIVQEYIEQGDRYDVCLLFNKSRQLRASFVQKELRHFPIPMGPSTVQESVDRPDLIEMSVALIEQLDWYGIVELEYMIDVRDGKPKFMEINPRFWNSLYMAMIAGVDFPWLLYQMAVEGDIRPVTGYKTGVLCRWLLPGDLLHFLSSKDRWKMNPPLMNIYKCPVHDDILSRDDPFPTLGFLMACVRYLFDPAMWKLIFRR